MSAQFFVKFCRKGVPPCSVSIFGHAEKIRGDGEKNPSPLCRVSLSRHQPWCCLPSRIASIISSVAASCSSLCCKISATAFGTSTVTPRLIL